MTPPSMPGLRRTDKLRIQKVQKLFEFRDTQKSYNIWEIQTVRKSWKI